METKNLELYNKMKRPPEWAKKTIQAGRLKGKTDINPQWRIQVLTENFGICGIGWKYEIESLWLEKGANNEIACFAKINLYIKLKNPALHEEWSSPIPGVGGNKFITEESKGLHTSDECYKMAITDAISVAAKFLGVGAEIYANYIESKYDKEEKKIVETDKKEPKTENKKPDKWINIHPKGKDELDKDFISYHNAIHKKLKSKVSGELVTIEFLRKHFAFKKEVETALLDKEFINNFNDKLESGTNPETTHDDKN